MEIYRNFEINDSEEKILKALNNFRELKSNECHLVDTPKELDSRYILYKIRLNHKLRVVVYLIHENGKLRIANILPDERSSLTMKEYNEAVMTFVERFSSVNPQYSQNVTSNEFNPLNIMSQEALEKLKNFYFPANKSTGSAHPDDEKRWFEFICQTVEDDRIITDEQELIDFLLDKDYWQCQIFDEDIVFQLVHEYSKVTGCLKYYKNHFSQEQ